MSGRLADEAAGTPTHRPWTADEIRALGVRTDIETAGRIFGVGRTKAHELARRDEFPAKVLRIGARYIVLVSSILRALELDDGAPSDVAPADTTTAGSPEQQNADSIPEPAPSRSTAPQEISTDGRSSPRVEANPRHLRGL